MKMNLSAVVLSAVAFFAPVAAYADEVTDLKPGESATGFINPAYGFDQRTELWNTKELVIRHNGVLKKLNVTKYICVPTCYYKIEYVGNIEPKQQINYYDMNQLLRPNSGGQNVPDSEVERKAKEMGVEKERLKKALADKNEMARLIREIEVKRDEQKKKEAQEKQGKGGGGGSSGGGGGSSGGGGGSSGGGGGSSGGGGGSNGGGSNGGGSNGHGSNGGGSNGGGGGSSGGGSNGGGSNGGGSKKRSYYKACYDGSCNYGDSEAAACSGAAKGGLRFLYEDGSCLGTNGKNKWLWGVSKVEWEVQKETGCKDGFNRVDTGKGSFSVVCNVKHGDTDFGGYSVGSLGGQNSSSSNNSTGSNSSGSSSVGGGGSSSKASSGGGGSSSKASGAGASAGGNGANDGGRASSAGGGTAQNSSDQNKSDSSKNADSDGNSGGNADGNGDGQGSGQYGIPDVPDVPDGGGEPDWGGIKSDGNFGTFSPSSTFATGGQCPQDILLDFGQFGRHSFSWSPICEAAQRLRYVFITLAYFMSAMMVYKTVNSMKG